MINAIKLTETQDEAKRGAGWRNDRQRDESRVDNNFKLHMHGHTGAPQGDYEANYEIARTVAWLGSSTSFFFPSSRSPWKPDNTHIDPVTTWKVRRG